MLVVHSGAAVAGTAVLDRHPDLVDHTVFFDAAPVSDGYAMDHGYLGDDFPLEAAWDPELADGSMRGLDDEQLATFRTLCPSRRLLSANLCPEESAHRGP